MPKNPLKTWIELNSYALDHNIKQLKKIIGQIKLGVVLKSNAYGHGIKEIGEFVQKNNDIEWICTSETQEAIFLRENNVTKPILVLAYTNEKMDLAISHDIHFAVYNIKSIEELNSAAQRVGKKAYIHIKIDSGMSRLGILPENVLSFIRFIKTFEHISLFGIFTHFADAHNPNSNHANFQLQQFDSVLDELTANGINIKFTHAQSSSSLAITPLRKYSLVRIGALLYGIYKSEEFKNLLQIKYPGFSLFQVMNWKTHIIDIKKIPKDSPVGYDRTFITQRPTTIGILPIGYFDGYNINLQNKGTVLINDQEAPIIGKISMNLTTIDLTDIKNVSIGDEVSLLSNHPSGQAHVLARKAQTITNEITTKIHCQIPRFIIKEQITNTKDKTQKLYKEQYKYL